MRRREFITLAGSAVVWPVAARRAAANAPVIGFLNPGPGPEAIPHLLAAFRQGLAETGYVEGKNLAIEYRFTDFKPELMREAADDLVHRNVSAIFAATPEAVAVMASNVTTSIPVIALDLESDPLAVSYVKSLARPGGNMTGMFLDLPELSGKQIGLLKEIVPRLSRVGIFGIRDLNVAQFAATEAAARALALQAEVIEVRAADVDIVRALETARTRHVEAGILLQSSTVFRYLKKIGELAIAKQLPLISLFGEFPKAGGLIAYGPNLGEMFRRCGEYVGKILHGAKPSDLPIQRPERFDLVINLKTAMALAIDVPSQLQQLADEVIE